MNSIISKILNEDVIPVKTGISKKNRKFYMEIPTFVGMTMKTATLLLVIFFTSCSGSTEVNDSINVNHQGILREIMMEQKLTANTSLSDYQDVQHFYALGALEGLAGEILILDGKPLNGFVEQGKLKFDRSFAKKATLLVNSEVSEWDEVPIDLDVVSLSDIQSIVARSAIDAGINTQEAFPFILKGNFEKVEWHVINAAEAKEQNHEAFKKAGLQGSSDDIEGQILGFYSEKHEGVFTHHGSFLHMHFVNKAETEMGHVDHLEIKGGVKLLLPKIKK